MEEDKEEKRWYVSEDSITEFVNKNKHRFSTKQTNWSMTIYTLLFIVRHSWSRVNDSNCTFCAFVCCVCSCDIFRKIF